MSEKLNTVLRLVGQLDSRLVINPTSDGHVIQVVCNQTHPSRVLIRVVHDWGENTLEEAMQKLIETLGDYV